MSGVYYQHVIAKLRTELDDVTAELTELRDRVNDPDNTSPLRQLGRVNRLEVVDDGGRAYVADGITVLAALQDGGHTLKVYVK